MENEKKKRKILTLPNIMSFARILMIPLILWLYCVKKEYNYAVIVIALSAVTDLTDGIIARKFDMATKLGKVLDPIADKLTQAAVIVCLIKRYKIMYLLITVFVIKEIIMLVFGYLSLKRNNSVNSAKWHGKLATVTLYLTMGILIFFTDIRLLYVNILIIVCTSMIILSLVLYTRFYTGILKKQIKVR